MQLAISAQDASPSAPRHWWGAHTCHTGHRGPLGSGRRDTHPPQSGQRGNAGRSRSAAALPCPRWGNLARGDARRCFEQSWETTRTKKAERTIWEEMNSFCFIQGKAPEKQKQKKSFCRGVLLNLIWITDYKMKEFHPKLDQYKYI